MTDNLRDRIAAVILEAYPGRYGLGPARCAADWILAIPGIAVVELPEPDHHEPATEYTNGYVEWRYPHGSIATTDDGTIMWESWHITDPSKVRAAAAALLAAADRAEGSMRESDGSTLCVRCGKIASHHGELQQDGSPPGCGWTYDMVLAANYQLRVDSCTNTSYSGAADFAERDQ